VRALIVRSVNLNIRVDPPLTTLLAASGRATQRTRPLSDSVRPGASNATATVNDPSAMALRQLRIPRAGARTLSEGPRRRGTGTRERDFRRQLSAAVRREIS
jgi:hypothetical protein